MYAIAWGLVLRASWSMAGNLVYAFYIIVIRHRIHLEVKWEAVTGLWKLSVYEFITRLSSVLLTNTEPFLIGILAGPEMTAIYDLTLRANRAVMALAGKFGEAFLPAMSHLYGEGRMERYKEVFFLGFRGQGLFATVGMCSVVVFNQPFMKLLMGDKYVFGGMLLTALAAGYGFVYMVVGVVYQTLCSMGMYQRLCKVALAESVVKLGFQIPLISLTGILGPPLAGLISQQGIASWWLIKMLKDKLGLRREEMLAAGWSLGKPAAAALILSVLWWPLTPGISTWTELTVQAAGFVIIFLFTGYIFDAAVFRFLWRRGRE